MFLDFFSIFHSVKSPASGKENVWLPDSPDFENSPDFRTSRPVEPYETGQLNLKYFLKLPHL